MSCVGLDAIRELCFKQAAMTDVFSRIAAWVGVGVIIWLIEIIIYTNVLAQVPLSIAFPVMSLTYAASVLVGWSLLGEHVSMRRWAGTGLITAGVLLVGATGIA